MWPSDEMGKRMKEAFPNQVELHIYEKAGHLFREYTYASGFALGGTKEANASAAGESDAVLFQRLHEWHTS